MENLIMNIKDLKEFLRYYNRYIYSIVNQNNCEKLPDEITDEELDFLYNLYQEIEFNKPINKILNKRKATQNETPNSN